MKKLKLRLARLFHKESGARCRARLKRAIKELTAKGMIYNMFSDGENGYKRYY
jgi:hypothetical protein